MADNTQVSGGTGDVIRDKDRSGVKTQIVGLDTDVGGATEKLLGTANPLPVNLSTSTSNQNVASGTLTGSGASVSATVGASGNGTIVMAGGTYTNLPIAFEASIDNVNWFPMDATRSDRSYFEIVATLASAGIYAWNYIAPGYVYVRVRQTGAASTQTANPTVWITQGPFLYDPSPVVGLAQPQTSAVTSLALSTTQVTLLAANARRHAAAIYNDASAPLLISLAPAVNLTTFTTVIQPGGYYEVPPQDGCYVGIITGMWTASGSGAARITELV